MKRIFFIVIGCISLVLGAVGAVLPILPCFPFLLLALICFGKSSERLHRWFTGTGLYKNNLESYVKGEGMTKAAKIKIMVMVTVLFAIGFILMSRIPVARAVMVAVWLIHILYFTFKVRTAEQK